MGRRSTPSVKPIQSGVGPSAVSVTISGLTPNTTYHVHLHAVNADGAADGATISFTTAFAASGPGGTQVLGRMKVSHRSGSLLFDPRAVGA